MFRNPDLAKVCLDALLETQEHHAATLHAYCLMPDHLHVLVEVPESTSLKKFVRQFKQVSGFRLKAAIGQSAWQTSYHDRVLRKAENPLEVAYYIWGNPVTAGLVEDMMDYEWSGPREAMEDSVDEA